MTKTHEGAGGSHSGGRSLALKIKKRGLFWPNMIEDCENYALKCVPCQKYAPIIHAPMQELQASISAYPYTRWAMDIVCPMPQSRQCAYLIIVTNYFTKWVKAKAYKKPTARDVQTFGCQYIVCRHRLPYEYVTDNVRQFIAASFHEVCTNWNIRLAFSSRDTPKTMGKPKQWIKQ